MQKYRKLLAKMKKRWKDNIINKMFKMKWKNEILKKNVSDWTGSLMVSSCNSFAYRPNTLIIKKWSKTIHINKW